VHAHIIGELSAKKVMNAAQRAAPIRPLVEGESETGKTPSRAVRDEQRSGGPFVAINCAAIPESLLESELFGYEKGAFTGAVSRKLGKFEVAHRGTLFLDEIADLPLPLQAKVLRAIEHKRFERVGGTVPIQVDVRIVAATNRNLKGAVTARQFREDLYFRLSVFPIEVPPLRDRTTDVPTLARHFVDRFCRDQKKPVLQIAPAALEALMAYPWPGNIRELQNCLERAVILCESDTIQPGHLQLAPATGAGAAEDVVRAAQDPWAALDLSGSLTDATRRLVAEVERRKITARAPPEDRIKAAEQPGAARSSVEIRIKLAGGD
jgi:transcriptional regulator with GAF, ATPase, and Fis domain